MSKKCPRRRVGLANQKVQKKESSGIGHGRQNSNGGWQKAEKDSGETPRTDGECPKNQGEAQDSSLKQRTSQNC